MATEPIDEDGGDSAAGTLGDLLYADPAKTPISEKDWVGLVAAIASRDQRALQALYQRTHRPVFTLIVRITGNGKTADELTLDVFHDVWRRASDYDAGGGSVFGWIMNQARSRAIDRRFEQPDKRFDKAPENTLPGSAALELRETIDLAEQGRILRQALSVLTPDERQAIEIAFFSEFTHMQVAARLNEPLGTIKTRIHSGLGKLRQALAGTCMSSASDKQGCGQQEQLFAYALQALPPHEAAAMEAHIATCADCRQEPEMLRPIVESFVSWPTDVLRPPAALWDRLAERIAAETGEGPSLPPPPVWLEPQWEEVAPGITCKLLSTDTEQDRVSLLVRLAPGVAYPPHHHSGTEELHLLDGELFIEDRKLYPGDYNRAEAGTGDKRVWSETGCTCVLITSPGDTLQ